MLFFPSSIWVPLYISNKVIFSTKGPPAFLIASSMSPTRTESSTNIAISLVAAGNLGIGVYFLTVSEASYNKSKSNSAM